MYRGAGSPQPPAPPSPQQSPQCLRSVSAEKGNFGNFRYRACKNWEFWLRTPQNPPKCSKTQPPIRLHWEHPPGPSTGLWQTGPFWEFWEFLLPFMRTHTRCSQWNRRGVKLCFWTFWGVLRCSEPKFPIFACTVAEIPKIPKIPKKWSPQSPQLRRPGSPVCRTEHSISRIGVYM